LIKTSASSLLKIENINKRIGRVSS